MGTAIRPASTSSLLGEAWGALATRETEAVNESREPGTERKT